MEKHFWEVAVQDCCYTYYSSRQTFVSSNSIFAEWVMVLAESGTFRWETRNRKGQAMRGTAGFGELFCVRPGMPFIRHVVTETLAYHVFQWSFADGSREVDDVIFPTGMLSIHDIPRLTSTLDTLKPLFGKTDEWSKRRQVHLLKEVLHLTWQAHCEPSRITDRTMNEAAQLLRKHAENSFSMEEVSSAFGLSPVQFTRRFRAAHGCNPIEFLTQIRLEQAQRLLIETSQTLDQIALLCGWSSGVYLSHVFKKATGLPPGVFRAMHQL